MRRGADRLDRPARLDNALASALDVVAEAATAEAASGDAVRGAARALARMPDRVNEQDLLALIVHLAVFLARPTSGLSGASPAEVIAVADDLAGRVRVDASFRELVSGLDLGDTDGR